MSHPTQRRQSKRRLAISRALFEELEVRQLLSGNVPVAVDDGYTAVANVTLNVAAGTGVQANDTDTEADPLTTVLDADVSHGTLTLNADGSFSYTPAADYVGADSFTYHDNDGTGDSNVATVTINVTNNPPTAVDDSYSTAEDAALNVNAATGVLANDTDPDAGQTITAQLVDPAGHGLVVLQGDGSFVYTPDANYNGPDSFTYRVTDGPSNSALATVSLTVTAVNDAPAANNDSYHVVVNNGLNVDAATGVLANDTDVENDTLSAILVTDVSHGSLALNADGSFTYTPAADYTGADSFTYKANDGTDDSNVATVNILVNSVPVAVNDTYNTPVDAPLNVAAGTGVLANDTDANADPLTASVVANPAHGALILNADGSFTYTPDLNYHGADSFTYTASDGTDTSNTATVNITVNTAPVAVDDAGTTAEDTPLTVDAATGVLANDIDADTDALTAILVTPPAHGNVTLNADGSFTYTPDANYNGADSFTYSASDGLDSSNTATVNLTVTAVNDAPVATNDTYRTGVGVTINQNAAGGVLANDTDADSDPLTVVKDTDPGHGTLTLNADGSFDYIPTPGYNGADSFTYHVNDGTVDSGVATVSIMVNSVPVATDDNYSTAEDTALTVDAATGVNANDTDADAGTTLTATVVAQPTHGTLTLNADGSFTYTPAANYSGPDSFTYSVSDGVETSNTATVNLTVTAVNDAPVATDDTATTNEDTPATISVQANDTDADGDALTTVIVANPAHGNVVVNGDGTVTYTPAADYNGADSFTYKVNDGTADSNTATVSITVTAVNDAPVAADDNYTTAEDTPLTVNAATGVSANDTDTEGDALTAVLVIGPAHGSVTLNADGSFTYTPDANYNGADSFTYKVNDGTADSNVATVNLTVTAVNDAPVTTADSYTVAVNGNLNIDAASGVLANDTDPEGDPITAAQVAGPTHGTLTLNADGSFTYAPDADYHGLDSFTYTATDGTATSSTTTVTLAVNTAPVATDDNYTTAEDTALTVDAATGVNANDTDADSDPLSAVVVAGPSHGTLTLNPDGSFTYTPDANYNGADSFTYKVNDGIADSNTATVNLTITPVNDAPVATADSYTVAVNGNLNIDAASGVLANDTDVDADPLTAVLVSGPSHGTLTLNADGSFTYAPDADYHGTDAFTYHANDGALDSNDVTVTITVNSAPVATDDTYTTPKNTALVVAAPGILANDTDADSDTLTPTIVAQPAHGTLTVNADGSFTYTPTTGYTGADSFTYTVSDGLATSNTATVNITVQATNQAPVAVGDTYTTAPDTALTTTAANGVIANDVDADGDTLTATVVTGPTNGTLTLNADGSFTYTPNNGFTGTDTFTYTVSDGQATSNTATATITVGTVVGPNAAPVAADFSVTHGPGAPVKFNFNSNATDADNDTLTFAVVSGPAHGTVSISATGVGTYTPAPGYYGSDTFTYQVSDGNGGTDTATVVVNATSFGLAPSSHAPSHRDLVIIGTGGKDTIVLRNAGGGKVKAIRNGVTLGVFKVTGKVIIHAGLGNDLIDATGLKKSVAVFGGAGNDTIKGGLGADELYGQSGNDTIIVGRFAARVIAGAGDDSVLWP